MSIFIDFKARTSKAEQNLANLNRSVDKIEKTTAKTTKTVGNLAKSFATLVVSGGALGFFLLFFQLGALVVEQAASSY